MAKILIIEDEVKIAHLIKRGLEMAHYKTDLAHDGKNGLAKALANNFDLIILDIMLPELEGLEIAKSLRQKNIKTPIIMVTARDTAEDKAAGLEAGADDYLTKPFAFKELLARIKVLLKSKKNKIAENSAKDTESSMSGKKMAGTRAHEITRTIIKNFTDPAADKDDKINASEINKRILDNAPISIITIDKHGFITSANKFYLVFSKTNNYRNHNIFESKFFIRENLIDDYKKLLIDGTEVRRETCYERNNKGEDKYMKLIAVPLRDKEGNIEGALSMALDNTEAVLFKNKLQELNRNLEMKIEQRTAELKEANKELGKVLGLKVRFMTDVSHELRTSLAIIQGNLELINISSGSKTASSEASGEENTGESSSQIFNEIKRMSTMLTDLSLLAKSDSAVQKLDYERININTLISSVIKSLEVIAKEKNIEIKHNNSESKMEITADKKRLEKLLMNLVRNAIRYNKNNGWIKIKAKKEKNNKIAIEVEDSGIGIPEKHINRIFDRFYCVDKTKSRNEGGSGLGLAICKRIAEAHGGQIDVKSSVGKGSVFTVYLPCA